MYSGHPPFKNALDKAYVWIGCGYEDLFWKHHSQNKARGFFSYSFMTLISEMFKKEPGERLSLADIVDHKWLKGTIATKE